jgi:hypothetical protein
MSISSNSAIQGPKPSGSFVVSLNLKVAFTSAALTKYVAVAFSPVTLVAVRVPVPVILLHKPEVALPLKVPVKEIDPGSQTV